MLYVKGWKPCGCTFLGKGIVDHPEMGVIIDCREVIFDEWSIAGHWTGREEQSRIMYKTDTGYVFDDSDLCGDTPRFKVELYAPNVRADKIFCW